MVMTTWKVAPETGDSAYGPGALAPVNSTDTPPTPVSPSLTLAVTTGVQEAPATAVMPAIDGAVVSLGRSLPTIRHRSMTGSKNSGVGQLGVTLRVAVGVGVSPETGAPGVAEGGPTGIRTVICGT